MTELSFTFAYAFILASCAVGFLFGIWNWFVVTGIEPDESKKPKTDHQEPLVDLKDSEGHSCNEVMNKTSKLIQDGAITFLKAEYVFLGVFIVIFAILILVIDKFRFFTVVAFILGAFTSIVSGFIGMYVATRANVRVTYMACSKENALRNAFNVAFRGGCVMGFCLVSLALAILTILIFVYIQILKPEGVADFTAMFEFIAGYGLGGSTVALFCRVGGGIYTKAADVGADLVGKNLLGLSEDSPENPATIADNVGDNVGDIAGMGSDLFGSFAESTCAALVVSGTSVGLTTGANFLYPLVLSASGILVCIITAFFATHIMSVDEKSKIETTLKYQLIISTVLLIPSIVFITLNILPATFSFVTGVGENVVVIESSAIGVMVCALCGLVAGLVIGYVTDYYTSNAHAPTQELSQACISGAAINIIQGLALGYMSCVIPILALAVTIFVSFKMAGMYGIAIAALGMLSNLATSLAIDGYGPISDNAGGIAEMSGLPHEIRELTDALDAAGNTTAAVGKGFAIGSACLVSLALFGAFITRTGMVVVNILEPIQISCLIIGAMLPYAFSALTMKSVGLAASKMCEQVKAQHKNNDRNPSECIRISTEASLTEMILPGIIVIFTPLILGFVFGPKAVSGYLAGVIVSGVQMAISSSNAGGAWDNAKKYIEAKNLKVEHEMHPKLAELKGKKDISDEERKLVGSYTPDLGHYIKGSEPHKSAVVGDTVGDPLKDTSGPSLNILVKLSAIVSLVFGTFFTENALYRL
jgi:H+-translocating diphosphatase